MPWDRLCPSHLYYGPVFRSSTQTLVFKWPFPPRMDAEGASRGPGPGDNPRGSCPFLPSWIPGRKARVSWHSQGQLIYEDGKQECALCSLFLGTRCEERNGAGGRGERLLEGLECRLPRDTPQRRHTSPLSFPL